jgi:hypothetical protein
MATTDNQLKPFYHRRAIRLVAALAILAPAAYLIGRYAAGSAPAPWDFLASTATIIALGSLLGIPIGLFFGSLRSQVPGSIIHHFHPSFVRQQDKILEQIKAELARVQQVFASRRGDATNVTSMQYDTSFWTAAKASGQLFVMQEPKLLATIAEAYHWVEEVNRLEDLAFKSYYLPTVSPDNQNPTANLLAQARLLDGPLAANLSLAIITIDSQLTSDNQTPPELQPEPVAAHSEVS